MENNLEYYKRLPYMLVIGQEVDSDGTTYWTAEFAELRGCKTEGASEPDAVQNLFELFDEYIATLLRKNIAIPEPSIVQPVAPTQISWSEVPSSYSAKLSGAIQTRDTDVIIQAQQSSTVLELTPA